MNEHLRRKIEDHLDELEFSQPDLQPDATTLLISYGVTARAMAEAVQAARLDGHAVSALAVQSLWPVPENALLSAAWPEQGEWDIRRIIVAELNHGDFRREVERVVYGYAARQGRLAPEIIGIHRVDGELITPSQFLAEIM